MALPSNLYESYAAEGEREDISDLIFNIAPTETPVLSAAGTNDATQNTHQWQTDVLDTPDPDNAELEGDDATLDTQTPTVLVNNRTQISSKKFGVSGTLEITSKYGRDSEIAYLAAKNARALKTDVDMSISGVNQASVIGSASVARRSGSLSAWLETNVSFGTGGANGGFNTGTGVVDARTDATTLREFTQAQLDSVIQLAWDEGGKPTMICTGPRNKTTLSGFDGIGNVGAASTARTDRADRTIYATADTYYSNFGILNVVPSRHIRKTLGTGTSEGSVAGQDRNVFCLDPEYLKIAYLRPWQQFDLAKTGDSIQRQMLVEWTLETCNEKAHGLVADIGTP